MSKKTFRGALSQLDLHKKTKEAEIPGILGFTVNGVQTVDVPYRPGYVYVRLRNNTSEVIQAFNENTNALYNLPVIVVRDEVDRSRYKIKGRDLGAYQNWGTSNLYVADHTHSFFTGFLAFDDAVFVATGVALDFKEDLYATAAGTTISVGVVTGTFSRDGHTHPQYSTGSAVVGGGTADLLIYDDHVFKVTGTALDFGANINVVVTGSVAYISSVDTVGGGGGADLLIYDNSIFKVTGTALNFGDNLDVVVSGTTAYITAVGVTGSVGATGPQGLQGDNTLLIYDDNIFKTTGTAIHFNDNLSVIITGSAVWVSGQAGGSTGSIAEYSSNNITNPPTQEEISLAFGAPYTAGQGSMGLLDDAGLGTREYFCISDGTYWHYQPLIKAASSYYTASMIRKGAILSGTVAEEEYVVEPNVIVDDGLWKMWYRYDGWTGTPAVSYATSPEGINWTRYANNPILSGYFCPFVFKDGSTYHLYATTSNWLQFDHYTSTDGITFTLDTAAVIALGGGGAWDNAGLGNMFVWKESASDWRMIYEARGGAGVWKIGYATSSDGNSWSKSGSNPVISETGSIGGPYIYKYGSTYYMWAHRSATGVLPTDIVRYNSTNLTTWNYDGIKITRTGADEGAGDPNGQVADPHIVIHNHVMYLYYEGSPDGNTGTGLTNIKLITGEEGLIWQ